MLTVAFEIHADGGIHTHLVLARQHLVQSAFPTLRWQVREKTELAKVDAQHRDVAQRTRGADYGAVAAEDYLHVRFARVFSEGAAFGKPGAHLFGQRDSFGFAEKM